MYEVVGLVVALIAILGGMFALFKWLSNANYAMGAKGKVEEMVDKKIKVVTDKQDSFKASIYSKLDEHATKSSDNSDRILVVETQMVENADKLDTIVTTFKESMLSLKDDMKEDNKDLKDDIKELTRVINARNN